MALEDRPLRPGIEGGNYQPLTGAEVSQINEAGFECSRMWATLGWATISCAYLEVESVEMRV